MSLYIAIVLTIIMKCTAGYHHSGGSYGSNEQKGYHQPQHQPTEHPPWCDIPEHGHPPYHGSGPPQYPWNYKPNKYDDYPSGSHGHHDWNDHHDYKGKPGYHDWHDNPEHHDYKGKPGYHDWHENHEHHDYKGKPGHYDWHDSPEHHDYKGKPGHYDWHGPGYGSGGHYGGYSSTYQANPHKPNDGYNSGDSSQGYESDKEHKGSYNDGPKKEQIAQTNDKNENKKPDEDKFVKNENRKPDEDKFVKNGNKKPDEDKFVKNENDQKKPDSGFDDNEKNENDNKNPNSGFSETTKFTEKSTEANKIVPIITKIDTEESDSDRRPISLPPVLVPRIPIPTRTPDVLPSPPPLAVCLRSCPVTSEYNPICGTDYVTYTNIGRLECAKSCGIDVTVLERIPCRLISESSSVVPDSQQIRETSTTSTTTTTIASTSESSTPVALPLSNKADSGPSSTESVFTLSPDLLDSIFTNSPKPAVTDVNIDIRFKEKENEKKKQIAAQEKDPDRIVFNDD